MTAQDSVRRRYDWLVLAVVVVALAAAGVLLGQRVSPMRTFASLDVSAVTFKFGGTPEEPSPSARARALQITGRHVAAHVSGPDVICDLVNEDESLSNRLDVTVAVPDGAFDVHLPVVSAGSVTVSPGSAPYAFRVQGRAGLGRASIRLTRVGLVRLDGRALPTCEKVPFRTPLTIDEILIAVDGDDADAAIALLPTDASFDETVESVAFQKVPGPMLDGSASTADPRSSVLNGALNDQSSENRVMPLVLGDDLLLRFSSERAFVSLQLKSGGGLRVELNGWTDAASRNGFDLRPRRLVWLTQARPLTAGYTILAFAVACFLVGRRVVGRGRPTS